MNIAQVLRDKAAVLGNASALIDVARGLDRQVSFGELDRLSACVAAELKACGLLAGDGVLILHPVAVELYVFLIALFRIGAVAVFLDPSAGRTHVERCCARYPLKGFFGSAKAQWLRIATPALRRIPLSFCPSRFPGTHRIGAQTRAGLDEITSLDTSSPALVTFTSGSTGEPKAALRSHGFLIAQHRALENSLALTAGSMDLTTLPIFVLANLASGVTSMLPDADMREPGKIEPGPVLAQIRRLRATTTAASPAFLARLLEECERTHSDLPELKRVFVGGAPVFPNLLHKAARLLPQATITAVYGSTEAEPMAEIAFNNISADDFTRMTSGGGLLAGPPVSTLQLQVIHDQWGKPIQALTSEGFASMRAPQGDVGEIVVSGAHVLPGYLGGMGDEGTKFDVNGTRWHRTGDLGYFDERGRLWLLGRCSAKVVDNRGVLYPFAVECAAQQYREVVRAALVTDGSRRLLAIETKNSEVREKLRQSLAWAQIDEVMIVPEIPLDKRHNAKVDYPALARVLAR